MLGAQGAAAAIDAADCGDQPERASAAVPAQPPLHPNGVGRRGLANSSNSSSSELEPGGMWPHVSLRELSWAPGSVAPPQPSGAGWVPQGPSWEHAERGGTSSAAADMLWAGGPESVPFRQQGLQPIGGASSGAAAAGNVAVGSAFDIQVRALVSMGAGSPLAAGILLEGSSQGC